MKDHLGPETCNQNGGTTPDGTGWMSRAYDIAYAKANADVRRILDNLQSTFPDKGSFLKHLGTMSDDSLADLPGSCWHDVPKIAAVRDSLAPTLFDFPAEISEDDDPETGEATPSLFTAPVRKRQLPANLDILLPSVRAILKGHPARARNALNLLLKEMDGSVTRFYQHIASPSFKPLGLRNIGRTHLDQVKDAIKEVKTFVEGFTDEKSVEGYALVQPLRTLCHGSIDPGRLEEIEKLGGKLGHFPVFALADAFIANLDEETRTIFERCSRMRQDMAVPDRKAIASELGKTVETIRIKQLRMLSDLSDLLHLLSEGGVIPRECPYDYTDDHFEQTIEDTEGVVAGTNFANWILGNAYSDTVLLGDREKAVFGFYDTFRPLHVVPSSVYEAFDFEAFDFEAEKLRDDRRTDDEPIPLADLLERHARDGRDPASIPGLEDICRHILVKYHIMEVRDGLVILPANSRKNNPAILEDILREAGHPLTLEELHSEFVRRHPDRWVDPVGLRGSIQSSPEILPIGRSGTYTLAEFTEDTHRGGTIRGIVADYLESLPLHVAPDVDITAHVRRFRPKTDTASVVANLQADKSGTFSFYYHDGQRCVALSKHSVPDSYFPVADDSATAATLSLFVPKLVAFIEQNGRFPLNADKQAKSLYYFWHGMEKKLRKNTLAPSALHWYESIMGRYGHLKISKREADWRAMLGHFKDAASSGGLSTLTDEDRRWYARNLAEYNKSKDSMPPFHREGIEWIAAHLGD